MTPRFTPSRLVSAIVLTLTITLALASCAGTSTKAAQTTTSESTTRTEAPAPTTTADPGTLPQTDEKPTGTGAEFDGRMKVLANAIITNTPDTALSAFFPVSAYKQTKKNTDPAADWKNRLIANFKVDVADANKKLGPNA